MLTRTNLESSIDNLIKVWYTLCMKTIELSQKYLAILDDEDWMRFSTWKWFAHVSYGKPYATRQAWDRKKPATVFLHHAILGYPLYGKQVDHINGNSLDNRRSNLRIVSACQNQWNRGLNKNNTSGYKGVCFDKRKGRWMARIRKDWKYYFLGYFGTAAEAGAAYVTAQKIYHG